MAFLNDIHVLEAQGTPPPSQWPRFHNNPYKKLSNGKEFKTLIEEFYKAVKADMKYILDFSKNLEATYPHFTAD